MAADVLKRLLLEPDGDKQALFSNQVSLARAIREIDPQSYSNERPLSSFLSQMLNGHRSCPKGLAELIVRAARTAALKRGGEVDARDTEFKLRAELDATTDSEVDRLFARQLRAQSILIINPEPQEVKRHPKAEDFQKAMCLALIEDEGARYRFVLSDSPLDADAIVEHWNETQLALENTLEEEGKPRSSAAELLARRNRECRILVTTIEPFSCAIPVVAFDADRRSGWPDVYVWDSVVEDTGTVDNIIRVSPELRIRWVRDFYRGYLFRPHLPDEGRPNPQRNQPHPLNDHEDWDVIEWRLP